MEILEYSENFEEIFFGSYFGKKPVVIRGFPRQPLSSERQVLDIISKRLAEFVENDSRTHRTRVFVEGELMKKDWVRFQPRSDEETIAGYLDRLNHEGYQRLCLALFSPHVYDHQAWEYGFSLIRGFQPFIGLPASGIDTEMFIGNYRTTPGGIHIDPAETFSFVISGRKKMLVWPFEVFQNETHSGRWSNDILKRLNPNDYLDQATVLEAGPSEVLYWPFDYWHVAIGDETPVATYNLSLYSPSTPIDFLVGTLGRNLTSNRSFQHYMPAELEDPELPMALREPVQEMDRSYQDLALPDLVRMEWTRYLSSQAFTRLPAVTGGLNFTDSVPYILKSRLPFSVSAFDEELLCVTTCGESFFTVNHPIIHQLFAEIQKPHGVIFRDFHEAISEQYDLGPEERAGLSDQLHKIGSSLAGLGALADLLTPAHV